jgi:hypothetical protein
MKYILTKCPLRDNNLSTHSIYDFFKVQFLSSIHSSANSSVNNNEIPVKLYANADLQKQDILINNKGKSGIYRWVNQINGKSYIGSSINIARRMYEYYNSKYLLSKKTIIYKALLKYGYSNFSLEILEYCDKKDLISREQYYLDLLKPEYNILEKAGNSLGYKHSDISKLKISEKLKGGNHPFFGKIHLEDTRRACEPRGLGPHVKK